MKRPRTRARGGNNAPTSSAAAAVSRVQTSGIKKVDASTALTDTFNAASNFTAGNTVILTLVYFNASNADVTGVTMGGTAAVEDIVQQCTSPQYRTAIWRATNVAGGTSAVVISTAGSVNHYIACSFEEWSGFLASPLDQTGFSSNVGATTGVNTGATVQAAEVVYGVAAAAGNFSSGSGISGPASGYTQTVLQNTTGNIGIAASYKIVAATGAQAGTWTTTDSSEVFAVIATYKTN